MTMPHLMNCGHSEDGWCLDCVKWLWESKNPALANRQPPEGTVRVRIAVAINPNGDWSSGGWHNYTDDEAMRIASNGVHSGGAAYHFIEADVPLPVPQTIHAEVVQ